MWQPATNESEPIVTVESAVYQAIRAATNPGIWGEDGVFQEKIATDIAEGLLSYLREHHGLRTSPPSKPEPGWHPFP